MSYTCPAYPYRGRQSSDTRGLDAVFIWYGGPDQPQIVPPRQSDAASMLSARCTGSYAWTIPR